MDSIAVASVAVGLSSLVTSAVWSMTAFSKYVILSERLAVLETRMSLLLAHHETSCMNWSKRASE